MTIAATVKADHWVLAASAALLKPSAAAAEAFALAEERAEDAEEEIEAPLEAAETEDLMDAEDAIIEIDDG
jgi:hypothetical protein